MTGHFSMIACRVNLAVCWQDILVWVGFGSVTAVLVGVVFWSALGWFGLVFAALIWCVWIAGGLLFLKRQAGISAQIMPDGGLIVHFLGESKMLAVSQVCFFTRRYIFVATTALDGQVVEKLPSWWFFSSAMIPPSYYQRIVIWAVWWLRAARQQ